ncbi:MAG: efflux RND transporter periplasmic adaptor subunit [Proteobacteria bacterium]|uniref:Efflux RND transporter periplasmic adaptor subunit n=1 Tax=Candidatus Enterousia excrementavium TaxID=2840789 RepID=A0A940DF97_9PROT|nr:efflux RND transporter periplasmic adaptor subunit [Candidatus Enterousia excrementavium]
MSKEQKQPKQHKLWKLIWQRKWWIILFLIVAGGFLYFMNGNENQGTGFATATISRGDLRQVVTATGEIQPLNTINVGSQVSGTIEAIYVDYNSKVKKGDVLLKIEPSVLQASVDEAHASLVSAESQLNYAKSEYERNKELFAQDYIARADLELSQTNYEQAEQSVKRMQSQYDRAVTNLGYATITSPVDGTVISRQVDVGQTVAASFQTPDLFEIAEDLSKMQIETAVSEADIGMITEGLPVTFTVDAYPTQTFQGTVRQVRLSPTITSNVVVYTVVIDVDNSDLKLKPGMTAFVTILISEKTDVWKVQNSALILRNFDGIVENAGDATPDDHLAILRVVDGNETVVLVPYEKGLVTATETEIISDEIQNGDRIIFGRYGLASSGSARMGPPR